MPTYRNNAATAQGNAHIGDCHHNSTINITHGRASDTTNSDRFRCLTALCSFDAKDDVAQLRKTKGEVVEGTCAWVQMTEEYQKWKDAKCSSMLQIIGGPGKGKTMISMFLSGMLKAAQQEYPEIIALRHFCHNAPRTAEWNTATGILKSFIYQLLKQRDEFWSQIEPDFKLRDQRLAEAKDKREALKHDFFDDFAAMWRVFTDMLLHSRSSMIYCILDGLDECDVDSIETILAALGTLYAKTSPVALFKIILVRRPLVRNVPSAFLRHPTINLDAIIGQGHRDQDLRLFIDYRLAERFPTFDASHPWRISFHAELLTKAQGTFLWLAFAIEAMQKADTLIDARMILKGLPPGLDNMYEREMMRIPPERREKVVDMLQWIVVAFTPLTLCQIHGAMELGLDESLTPAEVARDFIEHCGYIFVIAGEKVGLVHQSAKEYFLKSSTAANETNKFGIVEADAHAYLARRCIDYVEDSIFAAVGSNEDDASIGRELDKLPLFSYCTLYWPKHAAHSDADIYDLERPFFTPKSPIRSMWTESHIAHSIFGPEQAGLAYLYNKKGSFPLASDTLMFVAARFGLRVLIWKLLPDVLLVTHVPLKLPLTGIVTGSQEDIMRQMLRWDVRSGGVCPCLRDSWPHDISMRDYEDAVRSLRSWYSEVNQRDAHQRTPLHVAIGHGHESVARLLLEWWAEFDEPNDDGETPLFVAAGSGQETMVEILLRVGARVDGEHSFGAGLLSGVTSRGWEAVVQLPTDHGKERSNTDLYHLGTPLTEAVLNGHKGTVQLLLAHNANVDHAEEYGSTPLILAADQGHEALVRLLLCYGAELNRSNVFGMTALSRAVDWGHKGIADLLLEHGAEQWSQ